MSQHFGACSRSTHIKDKISYFHRVPRNFETLSLFHVEEHITLPSSVARTRCRKVLAGEAFVDFTNSDANVLLLSGAAGSGKSTAYDKLQSWILNDYTKKRKKEVTSLTSYLLTQAAKPFVLFLFNQHLTMLHHPHHRQYSHFTLSFPTHPRAPPWCSFQSRSLSSRIRSTESSGRGSSSPTTARFDRTTPTSCVNWCKIPKARPSSFSSSTPMMVG